jgi:uncharacterized protein (AIM24 family)
MQYEISGNPHCLKLSLFEENVFTRDGKVIYKTERIEVTAEGIGGSGEAGIESCGRIKVLKLAEGDSVFVCGDSWLACESTITKQQSSGNLVQFSGPGMLFIEANGDFFDFLLEEGERLEINRENLVAVDPTVTFEEKEDFVLATGPGAVMVQTSRKERAKEKKEEFEGLFGNMFG